MSRVEITQRSQRLNPGFPGWEREAVKPSEMRTVAELESGTFSFTVQHTAPADMHLILGGEFKTPLAGFSRHWVLPVYFFQKKRNLPVFPRGLQELLRSSPGEHRSDATCPIPRQLCSNQGSRGKLSSASLTRMAFHDSLPQRVTYQHSSTTETHLGRVRQPGQTNSHHSSRRKPRGSRCQKSCAAQVEKRASAQFLYGCARSSLLRPKGKPAGSGEAAEYRGTSAFGEQRGHLTQARRAPHKGRPPKVSNVLADPCQVPLLG